MSSGLPPPTAFQPFAYASVLEAGHVLFTEKFIIQGGSPSKSTMFPSMAFLLRHSQNNKTILFDLGIRKDWENYPPQVVHSIKSYSPVHVPIDVVDSLRRGGMEPDGVDVIVLSHIHFDHLGDPSLFPRSRFVVGAGTETLLSNGHCDKRAEAPLEPEFAKDVLPTSRTTYISIDQCGPIGPFPHAHDFFGDGSIYLVDAPGHIRGHLNILLRTNAKGSWLYLGGDSAHDVRILSGEKKISVFPHPATGSLICMHRDVEVAQEHIERIRRVGKIPKVQVLMAHDLEWYEQNKDNGIIFPARIKPW